MPGGRNTYIGRCGAGGITISESVGRDGRYVGDGQILREMLVTTTQDYKVERALILLVRGTSVQVLAHKEAGRQPQVYHSHQTSVDFATSVVLWVAQIGRSVCLNDAMNDGIVSSDTYVQTHKPRSLCCLPIVTEAKPVSVLYLENTKTVNAFPAVQLGRLEQRLEETMQLWWLHLASQFELTDKECDVLRLMAEGLKNREIAERLFIAEGTVKWHGNRVYRKLGVTSRTQAVIKAAELGLI